MYPDSTNKLWLVESIYAMIEVKIDLSPSEIKDSINKCINFQGLRKKISNTSTPKIRESLFIVWGFNGPSPKVLKDIMLYFVDSYIKLKGRFNV